MMIFMDPPRHDELRQLVSRAFTPRRVAALEARVRELCARVPRPAARRRRLRLRRRLRGQDPDDGHRRAARRARRRPGSAPQVDRRDDAVRARRRSSAEKLDAMRALRRVHARRWSTSGGGRRETTWSPTCSPPRSSATTARRREARPPRGDGVLHAARVRRERDDGPPARLGVGAPRAPSRAARQARRRPALVPNAVEELLRYEPPSPIQARFVTRSVEWHGTGVPAHSKLALLTGSAGRDEREYADPDRFDVERRFDRHVTFGYGVHFCLGANLARLEARGRDRRDARPLPGVARRRARGRVGPHFDGARPRPRPHPNLK